MPAGIVPDGLAAAAAAAAGLAGHLAAATATADGEAPVGSRSCLHGFGWRAALVRCRRGKLRYGGSRLAVCGAAPRRGAAATSSSSTLPHCRQKQQL